MTSWNKGLTKLTSKFLLKTSATLAGKEMSNFCRWQEENKVKYSELIYSKELAEFYGTVLGDGCMEKFQRTDKITISFNRKEQDHLQYIFRIIFSLFNKEPKIRVRKDSECDDIYLYQKNISSRLEFPYGNKLCNNLVIPQWIKNNKLYLKHCLKGLFETDGDWFIDKKYNTNVIKFTNHSTSLLNDLYSVLINLDYHPQLRESDVRLARRKEVYEFVEWIQFRKYSGIV